MDIESKRLKLIGVNSEDTKKVQSRIIAKNWDLFFEGTKIGEINFSLVKSYYEIMVFIKQEYREQGFATEALKEILKCIIENNEFIKIKAKVPQDNYAMARVLVKSGFHYDDEDEIFKYVH